MRGGGGLIEDLQYVRSVGHIITDRYAPLSLNDLHLICFFMFFATKNCYDFCILEFEPSTRNLRMFLFLEAILQRYVCTGCLRPCGTIDVK